MLLVPLDVPPMPSSFVVAALVLLLTLPPPPPKKKLVGGGDRGLVFLVRAGWVGVGRTRLSILHHEHHGLDKVFRGGGGYTLRVGFSKGTKGCWEWAGVCSRLSLLK